MHSRKVNYLKNESSQYVYELPSPEPEDSNLFVSFRKVEQEQIDLIKSCDLINNDPELRDLVKENTIYLDTVTNKKRKTLKNQTKFLLAPILHKLKEQNIKYIYLFPSVMEAYTKEYRGMNAFIEIGKEFKKLGCSNEKLVEKMIEQRKRLASYYEKLGFKSYDSCPGFTINDESLLKKELYSYPLDLDYECSSEIIRFIHPDSEELISLKIPSQYWMIAKVNDVYKILFTDCIKERIVKFKELGAKVFSDVSHKIDEFKQKIELVENHVRLVNELNQQIEIIQVDNFNIEFNKLKQIIDVNKIEIDKLKEVMNDVEFQKDLTDLINFGQQLVSGTVSTEGLVKCLKMVKEFEDRDTWILNGGTNTGFYFNSLNSYKKLYLKYKTKYLKLKNI